MAGEPLMSALTQTVVPSWIAVALGAATLCLILAVVLIGMRGKRAAKNEDAGVKDAKALRRLFTAALIPSLGVIASVMAISFVGLASFARDDMGWHSWIRFIVPVSLDGISITFGFWAFVAVKRGRDPRRSEKIVYIGALISAWINFNHGRQEWTGVAGIYLGFLSLASAWMFHELLAQFSDGHENLPKVRRNGIPVFGERWLWAMPSTFSARRAWIVYPPAADVEPTVSNALSHLQAMRVERAQERQARKTGNRPAASLRSAPVVLPEHASMPAASAHEVAGPELRQPAVNATRPASLIGTVTR